MSRKYIRNAGVRKMSGKGKSHSNKPKVSVGVRELSGKGIVGKGNVGKGNVW